MHRHQQRLSSKEHFIKFHKNVFDRGEEARVPRMIYVTLLSEDRIGWDGRDSMERIEGRMVLLFISLLTPLLFICLPYPI